MVLLRINKIVISIYIYFLSTLSCSAVPQIIQKLWGTSPPNNIQLGTFFYHVEHPNLPAFMTRPLLGLTYHSFAALFTKNCFHDNVFGLSMQRTIFSLQNNTNLMVLGYRAGAVYGWCYKNRNFLCASHCGSTIPIIPAVQLVANYYHKNVGIEISSTLAITNLNFVYRF